VRGDRASFVPAKQRCTLKLPAGDRASESTGSLTLKDGTLTFDVGGAFSFYPPNAPPAIGTFKHRWTLHR
jgi:hypothetical protein